MAQLLFLEAEDSTKPIHLYINSPGGSVTAGLAIYDTVSYTVTLGSYVFVLKSSFSPKDAGTSLFHPKYPLERRF